MTPIDQDLEREMETRVELGDIDLDTAKLDDMAQVLGRLELEKRDLIENIRVLRVHSAEEKEDQNDIYYYLHKKLDDNYDVISTLERQLMIETADREKAETEYARQIEELEIRRDEELGPLKAKLITEEDQLNGLHEASKNKRETDANRRRLESEIETTKSTVEKDLNAERRKTLQEKQRVRRQVEEEILELSSELFSKKEVELADKTVRAKDNNEKLHAALNAKAKQAERMMLMNQGLAFENRSLRNDLDLAKASETVLDKQVRLYHDLVISLKARLDQEVSDAEEDGDDEQELAELEESLASGGGGGADTAVSCLETMSSISDTPPGTHVVWADGACGALANESVDDLRVAVENLQRLHAELQEEARGLAARVEESRAVDATARRAKGGPDDGDPVASCLLKAAGEWMARMETSRTARPDGEQITRNGDDMCLMLFAGSAARGGHSARGSTGGHNTTAASDNNSSCVNGSREKLQSARKHRQKAPDGSSSSKRGKVAAARGESTLEMSRDQANRLSSSPLSAKVRNGGGAALAAVTTTPLLRRELFYHLVDAFREYQTRGRSRQTAVVDGTVAGADEDGLARGQARGQESAPGMGSWTAAARGPGDGGGGDGDGAEFPPIRDSYSGGGGGGGSATDGDCRSSSGRISVSVRTLCDFGPRPECRSISTQTIAKHFPEKFASFRAARRLVVNTTFLTSNSSTVINSALSASTMRSWGDCTASLESQPFQRL